MTFPPPVEATAVDPFGLWQLMASSVTAAVGAVTDEATADAAAFAIPEENAPLSGPEAPAAVWTLNLTSAPDGRPRSAEALERLAGQVQAIQAGLAAAGPRVEAFLSAREQADRDPQSFSIGEEPPSFAPLPQPEAGLDLALDLLDSAYAGDEVNFGLPEAAGINWEELYQRLKLLFDSVNRQILHFAWIDTTLDGRLIARTTVNWGGDFKALWQSGLTSEQTSAHCRWLELALEARLANLRAVLTVSQIAGQIALAAATPLGPLQAMSLAWQFVNTLIIEQRK